MKSRSRNHESCTAQESFNERPDLHHFRSHRRAVHPDRPFLERKEFVSYFLARLAGRLHRAFAGIDREPVAHPDFFGADVLLVIWSALFGSCFTALAMTALFWDRAVNVICTGK